MIKKHWNWFRKLKLLGKLTVISAYASIGGFACTLLTLQPEKASTPTAVSLAPAVDSSPQLALVGDLRFNNQGDNNQQTFNLAAGDLTVEQTIVLPQASPDDLQNENENEAWQTLTGEFEQSDKMRRMLSRIIPIEIGGKDSAREYASTMRGPLKRAINPEARSPFERAAKAYIQSIVILAADGNPFPEYKEPDAIQIRLSRLKSIYSNLSVAGEAVKGDRGYATLLHGRFMVAKAALEIAANAGIATSEVVSSLEAVDKDLQSFRDLDGLLRFDYIALKSLLAGDLQDGYQACSAHLQSLPPSQLCDRDNLALRFHILRLNLFATMAFTTLNDNENQNLTDLNLISDRQACGAAISDSLEFIYDFPSGFQPGHESSEKMVTAWVDTLLVKYAELCRLYNNSPPWNQNRLQTMIIQRATQSRILLENLARTKELSPDYVLASLCLHYEAARLWRGDDIVGQRLILEHGLKYCSILLSDQGLLHTPLRTMRTIIQDKHAVVLDQQQYFQQLQSTAKAASE